MMKKNIMKIISVFALIISTFCLNINKSTIDALTGNISDPILHYNFDNEDANDVMNNYSGNLINNPEFVNSKADFGKALEITDGNYLQLPSNFKLADNDFTISFLVRSLETINDTVLFANKDGTSGNDDGFAIMNYDGVFANAGYEGVRYDSSSYSRDKTVLDGSWHHVTVVGDRDRSLGLYVDGVLSSENFDFSNIEGISLDTSDNYTLGAGSQGDYLQDTLYDEFMVFDSALSVEEIENLYFNYAGDIEEELQKQLDMITCGKIRVSLGANLEMKKNAVITSIKNQIDESLKIDIFVEVIDANRFQVILKKAGVSVEKEVSFDFVEKDELTIATYNIYGWGYPDLNEISDKLETIDADIAGLQEANYRFDGTGQAQQISNLGTYPYYAFKEGYGNDTVWGGSTIVSKYPLTNIGGENYQVNDDTNRSYVKATIQIDDKEIAIYNTHIVWLEDPELYAEYKKAQINELIEAVNADPTPYKIITGDFNTDQSKEELDQLLLNFNGANGWNNVWFETGELDSSMKIGCIDHIFTTTNIEFTEINTLEGNPSDHDILYANLKLKEPEIKIPTQLLDNAIKEANIYLNNEDNYEKVGIDKLKAVLDKVINEPINQENRYLNVLEIREAINNLQEKTNIDKTALKIALNLANAITDEDLKDVIPAVADEFKAARNEANEVYNNASASQVEVNNAFDRLASAMHMLDFVKGDKTALKAFIDKVTGLEAAKYTEATWTAFETELNEAIAVYEDLNAMQEEVNTAYSELVTAFLNLRLIPDKSLLEDLINQAEGLNVVNYTKATFDGLTKALNEAKAVFDNPNASQVEVDNAKFTLEKAIAGLQASTPSNVDNTVSTPVNNGDTTTSVKTGDESLAGMFATIALLSVAGYTVLRRKEN